MGDHVDFDKFISYFNVNENLSDVQKDNLQHCLYQYQDISVTDENPLLGFTNVVEHRINLKPDAVSKHQKLSFAVDFIMAG